MRESKEMKTRMSLRSSGLRLLMVYFDSEKQDELSTYLILKALYSRPGGNGN
jgi:hypothetical protein